ncbi:MAG: GNAT family N-acetyltransferase [Candidatus Helarchaeales archaeon]
MKTNFWATYIDLLKLPLMEYKKVKGLTIRNPQSESDLEEFVKVFNEIWSSGKRASGVTRTELKLEDAKKIPKEHIFLAILDGKVVGFLIVNIEEEKGFQIGVFTHLGVLEGYRNRGIASALTFQGGQYLVDKYGITKIKAIIHKSNKTAMNFIRFIKFEKEEEVACDSEIPGFC